MRLKRAQEAVWDTRPQSSIQKDKDIYYRIPLHPSLFTFPPELDYYPPTKYPNQFKNQRGKFKNFGGVFLTEVTTSEGSRFPRIRGGTQPEWLSMLLKSRVQSSVKRVNEWKQLEELKRMMIVEQQFQRRLGIREDEYRKNNTCLSPSSPFYDSLTLTDIFFSRMVHDYLVQVINDRLKAVKSKHRDDRRNATNSRNRLQESDNDEDGDDMFN